MNYTETKLPLETGLKIIPNSRTLKSLCSTEYNKIKILEILKECEKLACSGQVYHKISAVPLRGTALLKETLTDFGYKHCISSSSSIVDMSPFDLVSGIIIWDFEKFCSIVQRHFDLPLFVNLTPSQSFSGLALEDDRYIKKEYKGPFKCSNVIVPRTFIEIESYTNGTEHFLNLMVD